jgi:hypothetical protein
MLDCQHLGTATTPGDLRINYVVRNGHLGVQVYKHGVLIFSVALLKAATEIPKDLIDRYSPLSPKLDFMVGDCLELTSTKVAN